MAVTTTFAFDKQGKQLVGRHREVRGRLTLAGTYATGGFDVTAAQFGLQRIDSLYASSAWTGTTSLTTEWDSANNKIKLGQTAAAVSTPFAEVTNGNSVANYVVDVLVRGA